MNINLARTLANINHRAATLWADGYTATPCEIWEDTFTVTTPSGDEYIVVIGCEGSKPRCTCESFRQYRVCKHLIAVEAEYDRSRQQGNALDAMSEEEYFGRW